MRSIAATWSRKSPSRKARPPGEIEGDPELAEQSRRAAQRFGGLVAQRLQLRGEGAPDPPGREHEPARAAIDGDPAAVALQEEHEPVVPVRRVHEARSLPARRRLLGSALDEDGRPGLDGADRLGEAAGEGKVVILGEVDRAALAPGEVIGPAAGAAPRRRPRPTRRCVARCSRSQAARPGPARGSRSASRGCGTRWGRRSSGRPPADGPRRAASTGTASGRPRPSPSRPPRAGPASRGSPRSGSFRVS